MRTSGGNKLEDIIVHRLAETEKAIQVDDGTKIVWLPKSQIEYEDQRDGTCIVTAPIWLLTDKGLI